MTVRIVMCDVLYYCGKIPNQSNRATALAVRNASLVVVQHNVTVVEIIIGPTQICYLLLIYWMKYIKRHIGRLQISR
jgi:hypothetical protein